MPINGFAFRNIEESWPKFNEEPCNLRLSLATNNVNPFGDVRSTYSVWPIFVINNNIPSQMSIKRERIMLTNIVLGINIFRIFLFNK